MLRINRIFVFALAVLLAFSCLSEADIISDDAIVTDVANYKTTTVERGEYKKTMNASASIHYTNTFVIRYEGAAARFVEYNVKKNDEVKVGDLLATFHVERDEISIASMNLDIERTQESFEAGRLDYEKQLEDKTKQMLEAEDVYTREIRRLELEKINVRYEKYVYEMQNSISDKKDNLEKLLETYENTRVYSTVEGIISELTYLKSNQYVYDGTQLMVLYDPSEFEFRVSNGAGLRYNMEVTVAVGNTKNRVTGKGRVVASPMALPGSKGAGEAYVRVEEYDETQEIKSLNSPTVTYDSVYLGNVFVVDRKAVTLYGGKNYVYKLSENGMVSKRYVNYAFGSSATGALIIDGVTEGEKLIID